MEDTKEHKLYVLFDPRTPEEIRYVGYTCNTLRYRLLGHRNTRSTTDSYKNCWLRSMSRDGVTPEIRLYKVVTEDTWQEEEILAIAHFKSLGHRLVNTHAGGQSLGDIDSVKRRLSSTLKGRWQEPEFRSKMLAILKRTVATESYRASLSRAQIKVWSDPEHRIKRGVASSNAWSRQEVIDNHTAGMTKKWLDPEYRERNVTAVTEGLNKPGVRQRINDGKQLGRDLCRQQIAEYEERKASGYYDAARKARMEASCQ